MKNEKNKLDNIDYKILNELQKNADINQQWPLINLITQILRKYNYQLIQKQRQINALIKYLLINIINWLKKNYYLKLLLINQLKE